MKSPIIRSVSVLRQCLSAIYSMKGVSTMKANPILLQMKYARVVALFAHSRKLSMDEALTFFYQSDLYPLLSQGISDLHCMSDTYLAELLWEEYKEKKKKAS